MAFCKYCGTQLQDGELCNCERAVASRTVVETPVAPVQETSQAPVEQAAPVQETPIQQETPVQQETPIQQETPVQQVTPAQEAPAQQAAPVGSNIDYNEILNKTKTITSGIWGQFISIWKKPVDGGVSFVKNGNPVDALIFMVIQALLSGFLAIAQLGKIEALIKKSLGGVMSLMGEGSVDLGFPYAQTFFITLIASVIISALFVGTLFIGLKILKAAEGTKEVICLAGLRCVAAIPFTLIGLIFTFINQGMGLGINAIALIVSLVFLLQGVNAVESIETNKRGHLIAIVNVVVLVLVVLIGSTIMKGVLEDLLSDFSSLFNNIM